MSACGEKAGTPSVASARARAERAQAEVAGLLRGLGVTLMQATAWADCVKAVQPAAKVCRINNGVTATRASGAGPVKSRSAGTVTS